MNSNIKNVKELVLNKNNIIFIFAKELELLIPNIKEEGWHIKNVVLPNNKYYLDYIKEKNQKMNNRFIISNKLNIIIKIVANIMNDNGFIYNIDNIDYENTNVEFHYANSYYYNYPMFAPHKDNDNGINVNTFICYFDVDCDEGEFAIYDENENENEKTILSKINVKSSNENIKALIFSGNIVHNGLRFKNGHRYALSFQIPIYTGEDLKPHTCGVICFKSLQIPHD
jgi:hypothetical protein